MQIRVVFSVVFSFVSCQLHSTHDSTYSLFTDLGYDDIDYLDESDWHGYWNLNYDYRQNQDRYYFETYSPKSCDVSKGHLDCSKISSSVTRIDIRKKGITNITKDSFPENNSITVLMLVSMENLVYIQDEVFDRLTKLEKLVITRTGIDKLPQFSKALNSLTHIDLYDNKLLHIYDETFKHCPNLDTINLGRNTISYISPSAFTGTKTRLLTLSHNLLQYVPQLEDIGNTLAYMGLEHNLISVIGQTRFKSMGSLVHLNVSYNPISIFEYDCFKFLPNLRFLELIGLSGETEIPFEFLDGASDLEHITLDHSNKLSFTGRALEILPGLVGFSARYCGIKGLDFRSIQGTSSLTRIWLDGNQLSSFQHAMFIHGNFSVLSQLYLADNRINDIEWFGEDEFIHRNDIIKTALEHINATSFSSLPELNILSLEGNSISQIRDGTFAGVTNLEKLYLGRNLLDDDSIENDAFEGLENLQYLALDVNNLKSVPKAVYSLKSLETLRMNSNKLTFISQGDFNTMEKLKYLHLRGNRILLIENNAFPETIKQLDVAQNEFNFVDEEIFHNLTELNILYLSSNRITFLPKDIFSQNSLLDTIYLDNNYLKFINSSHFRNNILSSNIILNNNEIAYIGEASFSHVRQTGNIHLQYNELLELPSDGMFQNMSVSGEIRVDFNRLTHIKKHTFSNINCSYFKINDNDITEVESYAFNKIKVKENEYKPQSFDASNNPFRIIHEYAFNSISVGNQALFANVKPLKIIPSLAFNDFVTNRLNFSGNEIDMIEYKGFNGMEVKEQFLLNDIGLQWLDRNAIVGSVQTLRLNNNNLRRIPESALFHISHNKKLHLQNNFIDIIESNSLPNTKDELFLQNNSISILTRSMFGNNDLSQDLRLQSNLISRVEEDVFSGMIRLTDLNLGLNLLDDIPDNLFSDLTALNRLVLANNKIRHFGAQQNLPALETIDLKYNRVSQLDAALFGSGVPTTNFPLQSNRLSCGCGLFSALEPVQEAVKVATCNNPDHMTDVKLNWADRQNARYFLKVVPDEYVCEPVDLTVEKVDETSFELSWQAPANIRYNGVGATEYCYYDNCDTTQISFDVYCENSDGNTVKYFEDLVTSSQIVSHDSELPYYCFVGLNYISNGASLPSSYSQVVPYKSEPLPKDDLTCQDGTQCYVLTAEYFKFNKDVYLFNNYGPEKMVSSPSYKKNLLLNYLYKTDSQTTDDSFTPWYGPVDTQNFRTKGTLTLPEKITDGYKVDAHRFFPVDDNFNQFSRDCDYDIRALGFTSKLYSSIIRTNEEVLKLGSVDEGWIYFGGVLLVEIIGPADNTEDVCSEIRLLADYATVWTGTMSDSGSCQVDTSIGAGTTVDITGATKLEIFVSQRRNCASNLYLEMQNFNLVAETDYVNQEPTYIFQTCERKPIGGFIATMDLRNPFTASSYTIEILNEDRHFWFVDSSYDIVPDDPVEVEEDPGFNIPHYVPYKSTPAPTPLAQTSLFTVNDNNPIIILADVLDYRFVEELKIAYRVTGTLPNGDSLSSTGVLVIKITDYNNQWPTPDHAIYVWDGSATSLRPEPLQIVVTDADATINAEKDYFIGETVRPDNETFYKEVEELYKYEDVMLDYQATVHVLDKGTPRLGTTTTVKISISASCVTTLDVEIVQATGEFYVTAPGYYRSQEPKYCDPCAAGYYCQGKGSRAKCTTCDQEMIQTDGTIIIIEPTDPNCNRSKTEFSFGGAADCSTCLAGWSCANGTAAPVLDKGKYIEPCTTLECPEKEDCPKGAACRYGIKYDCEPGTYSSTGELCAFCPPGRYSDTVNSEQCDCCAVGYESSHKKSHCEPCAFNEMSSGCTKCMSCRNSTTCPCLESNPCFEGVQCVNKNGGYECLECPEGTEGDGQDCTDINECEVEGACFNGNCTDLSPGYECAPCPEFYSGDAPSGIGKEYAENNKQVCEDVNECEVDNGGCGDHVICINREGVDVECGDCEEGYTVASSADAERKICDRANKCEDNICADNAYCVYTQPLGYDCFCNIGYAGDGFNACGVDSDADGFPDDNLNCKDRRCSKDNCPNIPNISQGDLDNDKIGDACDIDKDEDGILNEEDNCPDLFWTKDLDFNDNDGDGVGNACDNCPDVANADQANNDRDNLGNACDLNNDQDSMPDATDTCPFISNSPGDKNDRDDIGDVCDNCVYVYNPDQADTDENGYGDACDDGNDYDGDGVVDSIDNCIHIPNPSQRNNDVSQGREDRYKRFTGDVCDNDIDADGLERKGVDPCPYIYDRKGNSEECFISLDPDNPDGPDADGDGAPDYVDYSYLDSEIPNDEGYFDFYDPKSPLKSFVFDGVTANTEAAWKYDPIHANYSNEFYQLTEMSSPFVGVTFQKFADIDIWGTWFVKGDTPGNYIGFVFGFQNPRKFYLVSWRRTHQTYVDMTTAPAGGLRGLHIKSIDASYGKSAQFLQMLWHTGTETRYSGHEDSTLLWYDRNTVPWEFTQAYRWYLQYRPSIGRFSLQVYQANEVIINTGPIYDNKILGGSFGVYAFDQPDTYWSNIQFHTEPRANGGIYLGNQEISKIPLNLALPTTTQDSLLVSLWLQVNDTTATNFNTTLLCTDTESLCIRLVNTGTADDNTLECRLGSVELEGQVSGSQYSQKNRDKTMKWRSVVLEYVLPDYAARLYIDNVLSAEVEGVPPQDIAYNEVYLGGNETNHIKLDELRILEGRIAPEERRVVVSDCSLQKYIAQGRLVVWYDMNEGGDSDTLLDRSGRGQHTTLPHPGSVRCSSKSEGYMYYLQYNSASVTQRPVWYTPPQHTYSEVRPTNQTLEEVVEEENVEVEEEEEEVQQTRPRRRRRAKFEL